jgi:HD-GYP domain-containing protein (c-di-GMP phosphodiesterase class II)
MLIEARIIAVADAMEAMLSDRPYRPSLGVEAAVNELIQYRGTAYDPAVVDACGRLFTEQGFELPD